ncbi:MAG: cbb3-type cytochrome c oxidase subunit I [Gammaproteobacteria bacterium]|uniref:Cbb3-type cytochrome c oxidase subunit I n=1 Tax=Candidatus Thiopontia autotrophica TaxID=2841688 RepID=A0A8J6TSD9_9GAMM|nr:cbb3-type cytochrome c oxidase subunit I [Candidatus Thiopontia autotrophica]MBL6969167.1 cbb3-type cytochrome c oxidase subunit I [Gammaproteobacteria bacterium]
MNRQPDYQPTIPEAVQPLIRGWIYLALASLIVPGLTAVLLVLLRTLVVDSASWTDLFRTALVVHVDLSVFVWFLAIGGALWTSMLSSPTMAARWSLRLAVAGTVIISIAPLLGATTPIMNNYIPVLDHPIFHLGLGLFAVGILLLAPAIMKRPPRLFPDSGKGLIQLGGWLAMLATVIAAITFIHTYTSIPPDPDRAAVTYYEILFWSDGHILQFTYTTLLVIAWLALGSALKMETLPSPGSTATMLVVGFIPLIIVPWILASFGVLSAEYRGWFTWLMRYGNSVAPILVSLFLLAGLFRTSIKSAEQRPLHASLVASFILFAAGGIIGFMISGYNTIIPAHYHGSIVGVTLAFMGLVYILLPKVGFTAPSGKMATLQPYIYAVGQLMHVAGLALSGGHGAARKSVGGSIGADNFYGALSVSFTRIGGLLAVVGGVLFLVVCWKSIRAKRG